MLFLLLLVGVWVGMRVRCFLAVWMSFPFFSQLVFFWVWTPSAWVLPVLLLRVSILRCLRRKSPNLRNAQPLLPSRPLIFKK